MSDKHLAASDRILVVKLSSLGDLFHALPAVHAVKQKLGVAVDWVTQPEYVDLVRCFTDVDHVVAFPRRRFWRGLPSFRRELRGRSYRHVLDMQGLLKSAVAARQARAGSIIGPAFSREGSRWLYDTVAGGGRDGRHAVDVGMDFAEVFGAPRDAVVFPVVFPDVSLSGVAPFFALAPVSRWSSKNWPVERYAALAALLVKKYGGTVLAVGSAADVTVCEQVVAGLGDRGRNLAGRLSLPQLGGVLSRVDLLMANDSGPVHMAAAVGTPCLVLFGPTNPNLTGPYGACHAVLRAPEPCQPCDQPQCPGVSGRPCLDRIDVEDVVMTVDALLAPAAIRP